MLWLDVGVRDPRLLLPSTATTLLLARGGTPPCPLPSATKSLNSALSVLKFLKASFHSVLTDFKSVKTSCPNCLHRLQVGQGMLPRRLSPTASRSRQAAHTAFSDCTSVQASCPHGLLRPHVGPGKLPTLPSPTASRSRQAAQRSFSDRKSVQASNKTVYADLQSVKACCPDCLLRLAVGQGKLPRLASPTASRSRQTSSLPRPSCCRSRDPASRSRPTCSRSRQADQTAFTDLQSVKGNLQSV